VNRQRVQNPAFLGGCLETLVKGLLAAAEAGKAEALLGRFDREVAYGYVGVEVAESPQEPRGLVLTGVAEGSPAQAAGLVPGDIITKVNGTGVVEKAALERAVRSAYPGEKLRASLRRGEQKIEVDMTAQAAPVKDVEQERHAEVPPGLQQAWAAMAKHELARGNVGETVQLLERWGPKKDRVIVHLLFLKETDAANTAPQEVREDQEVKRYVALLATLSGAELDDALAVERLRYVGQEKDAAEAMVAFVHRWPSADLAATYAKELVGRYGTELNYAAAQELVDFLRTAPGFAGESVTRLEERVPAIRLDARLHDAELSVEKKHFVEAVRSLSEVASEVAAGRVDRAYVNWSAAVKCFAHLDLAGRHAQVNDFLAVLAQGENRDLSGVDNDAQRLWLGAYLRDIPPEAVLYGEFWKLPDWAKQRLPAFTSVAILLTDYAGELEETWLNLGKEMALSPDATTLSRTLQEARKQWEQDREDSTNMIGYQVLLMLGASVYQSRGMYREAADVDREFVGLQNQARSEPPDPRSSRPENSPLEVFPTRAELEASPAEAVGLYLDAEREAGNGPFAWLRNSPGSLEQVDTADTLDQMGGHKWADFIRRARKEAPGRYRRLASQYPDSPLAAFALYRLGRLEEVILQYPTVSVAERASQDFIRSYESRGNYWLGTLRADGLLEHLKGQDRATLLWLAGKLWDERLGSLEHAAKYYREIADQLPGSRQWPEAEWRLAEDARESQVYAEAISRAEALPARAPEDQHVKDGNVTLLLARAFHESGESAKAGQHYVKLLREYAARRSDPNLVAEGLSRMPAADAGSLYQEFGLEFLQAAVKAGEEDKAKLLPLLERVDGAAGRKLEALGAAQEMLVALAGQDYKHLAEVLSRRAEVEVDPDTLPKCLPFEGLGERTLEAVELRDGAARVLFTVRAGPGRDALVVTVLLAEREGSWKLDLEGMRGHLDLSSTAWTPQQRQFLGAYPVFAVEQRQ
jgi:hypothetical protein